MLNKWHWETTKQIIVGRKLKLDPCLTPKTRVDSRWAITPNVSSKTIKEIEKYSEYLCNLRVRERWKDGR